MATLFSQADRAYLRRPHISRVWFALLDLPSGPARLHSGAGRVKIAGAEWRGITDPGGSQLVSIGAVEEPRFGVAAKIDIVIAGVNVDFLRSVKTVARELEGRRADVYWCAFDQETAQPWSGGMKKLWPGKLSSPVIRWAGTGIRTIAFSIEGPWQSQSYQFGGKWNPADQRRRYPGDKGLDFIGTKIQELIRA
ncbi:transcriptional regulator [Neorhizobium alkalisoli]|uniref:Uncharacterized protein n=1 Tax=Neorhizobium alkalisoli TaxID=528178 RepID=A0A561QSA2_9HYPH|nr:transcriptional regulator [Neorhizobium alkalisoli]TWF53270.1 hypothetical protein FHW37_104547 [Neorhizobium alkalisoli]